MKIAVIAGIFFPHPGGAQVQIHNLANKLSEKKVEVDCYIFDKVNLKNNNYKIILLNKLILSFVFIDHHDHCGPAKINEQFLSPGSCG